MTWLALLPFLTLLATKTKANVDPNPDVDDPDDDDEDEEIRNPKALVKSLRDANARLARKNKKLEQRIQRLEGEGDSDEDDTEDEEEEDDPRLLKLENLFLKHVREMDDPIVDLETAFDLFIRKGFADAVKDDGEGIEEAVGRLVDRYPYLADVTVDDEPAPTTGSRNTGRTPRRPSPQAVTAAGNQALAKRFPALRSKVRRRG
jgi:hypothetical protein